MFSRLRFTSAAARAISSRPSSREVELDPVRAEERGGLLRERVLGLGEDPQEVLLGERVERDADREAALELRDEVRGLRDVERAGRDEEDVVRLDHPVLRLDGRALDEREEVALDALARDVGPAARALAPRDLVDLVEEDDARLLGPPDRLLRERRLVREGVGLALEEERPRLGDRAGGTFFFFGPPKRPGSMPGEVDPHLLHALRRP